MAATPRDLWRHNYHYNILHELPHQCWKLSQSDKRLQRETQKFYADKQTNGQTNRQTNEKSLIEWQLGKTAQSRMAFSKAHTSAKWNSSHFVSHWWAGSEPKSNLLLSPIQLIHLVLSKLVHNFLRYSDIFRFWPDLSILEIRPVLTFWP